MGRLPHCGAEERDGRHVPEGEARPLRGAGEDGHGFFSCRSRSCSCSRERNGKQRATSDLIERGRGTGEDCGEYFFFGRERIAFVHPLPRIPRRRRSHRRLCVARRRTGRTTRERERKARESRDKGKKKGSDFYFIFPGRDLLFFLLPPALVAPLRRSSYSDRTSLTSARYETGRKGAKAGLCRVSLCNLGRSSGVCSRATFFFSFRAREWARGSEVRGTEGLIFFLVFFFSRAPRDAYFLTR